MSARYEARHCPGTVVFVVVDTHHHTYVNLNGATHFLPALAYDLADELNDAEDDEP